MKPDPKLIEALTQLCDRFSSSVHAAVLAGKIEKADVEGVMVSSLTRAIDRIKDLPDELHHAGGEPRARVQAVRRTILRARHAAAEARRG